MNSKLFKDSNGLGLIVKSRKSAVIFELAEDNKTDSSFRFDFDASTFDKLFNYIEEVSDKSWTNVIYKEATSEGSDYYEYYDKKLDNNGYLVMGNNAFLYIQRPSCESNKLYQFNKRKMESFLYDYRREYKEPKIK